MSFRTASLNLRLAARQPAAASRQQLALRQLHSTRTVAAPSLRPEFQPHVGKFTIEATLKWVPALAFWGAAGAGAVTLFLSGVPRFKEDILFKLPFIAEYFKDKTPDSDKPF